MWAFQKHIPLYAAEGEGGGASGGQGAAGGTGGAGSGGGSGQATPWHGGKIDADTLGFWQNKGLDASDPIKLATGLTTQYRQAESLRGVPANELIRVPKPDSPEADVKAFWGRVGVAAEPKDYDFNGIKFKDGSELDQALSDTLRTLLYNGRVPKDRAGEIVKGIVKWMDDSDAAEIADRTAYIQKQQDTLRKNWGPANYDANLVIARSALQRLGGKAGLTAEQTAAAWDALSKVGGVDAALAMEMMRVAGVAMGEDRYISGGGSSGDPALMSREAARQEIDALKKDAQFRERLMKGDRETRKKWDNLHQVAFGQAA
jgi:hypothetical protein